jgi:hypothetical protein
MTPDNERNASTTLFAPLDGAIARAFDRPTDKPPTVPARPLDSPSQASA